MRLHVLVESEATLEFLSAERAAKVLPSMANTARLFVRGILFALNVLWGRNAVVILEETKTHLEIRMKGTSKYCVRYECVVIYYKSSHM